MAKGNDPRRDRDREVGYSRPPKEHQIKPGEVRNRWGCKGKPSPKTDFMDELVEVRVGDEVRKMTRQDALDYGLFLAATKGNVPAAKELDRRRKDRLRLAVENNETADVSAEGRAALSRYVGREIEERQKELKGKPDEALSLIKAAARDIVPGHKK